MSKLKVICIGEALIDKLINKSDDNFKNYLGGAPANVVCALRKLGVPSTFIGCVGDDDFGKEFVNLFQKLNVNIDCLQISKQSSTRVIKVIRDECGDRSFSGFEITRSTPFADEMLDKLSIIHNINDLKEQLLNTKYIVTGTNLLASSKSAESLYFILDLAKDFKIKIIIDINWREIFWDLADTNRDAHLKKVKNFLNYANIIKLASEEAYLFFKTNDPSEISQVLNNQPDVIITDGPNPIKWYINGIRGINEAVKNTTKIIDTTGAGDAFLAGLISRYYLDSHLNDQTKIKDYVRFASVCGLLTCFGEGAIEQQPEEKLVYKFLEDLGS